MQAWKGVGLCRSALYSTDAKPILYRTRAAAEEEMMERRVNFGHTEYCLEDVVVLPKYAHNAMINVLRKVREAIDSHNTEESLDAVELAMLALPDDWKIGAK